jgi:hypothetical protein
MERVEINECISNCSLHGLCKLVGNQRFLCECDDHFHGPMCSIDLRPCSSQIECSNNRTCEHNFQSGLLLVSNIPISFTCKCDFLHTGQFCESKINLCANETCSSNGYCNNAVCECFYLFDGDECEIESRQ